MKALLDSLAHHRITDDSTPIWIMPSEQNAKILELWADSHSQTGGCDP